MALIDALLLDPAPFNVWISYRQDGLKGSGTVNDPFDGSTQVRFDAVMKEIGQRFPDHPVTVHLGPGSFETNGYSAATTNDSWHAKKNMRILGSGIDVTTLRLVNATTDHHHFFAIGHALDSTAKADLFEVSDLTIDCNLSGNGTVACGGVRVMGDHARIRRVKAINWGTKSASMPCFALAAIAAAPEGGVNEAIDVGIEDCIVIEPADAANVGPATAIHAGGTEAALTDNEKFGRGPLIRHCFVDCGRTDFSGFAQLPVKYRGLSMSWCRGGIVEGNQVHNTDLGLHLERNGARDLVVRNNFLKNVARGIFLNLGGVVTLGTLVSQATPAGGILTVQISANIDRIGVGDRVKFEGSNPASYNGVYVVTAVEPANSQFSVVTSLTATLSSATVKRVVSVSRALVEGNSIELCLNAGTLAEVAGIVVADANATNPYSEAPDFVHGDFVIRNNKIRYLDSAAPEGASHLAIDLAGIKRLHVTQTIVDSANPQPIKVQRCGAVRFFNNQSEIGAFVPGLNAHTGQAHDELAQIAEDAEDAFITACYGAA